MNPSADAVPPGQPAASPAALPAPLTPGRRLAARALWSLVLGLSSSLRWSWEDRSGLFGPGRSERAIFAIWHNRQGIATQIYQRAIRRHDPSRRLATLASLSRDGAVAARMLELAGVAVARGSSTRGGTQALAQLIDLARQGHDLAVTPDGPRGPRYCVQPGVIALAQYAGLPIVPVSYRLSRRHELRSWDRFQIPLPLARCEVILGPALRVPRRLTEAARAEFRAELESRLRAITPED